MDIKPGSIKAVLAWKLLANRTESGLKIVTEPEAEVNRPRHLPFTGLHVSQRRRTLQENALLMATTWQVTREARCRMAISRVHWPRRRCIVVGPPDRPSEVESVLMEHKAVAGSGVIGVPDDVAGELVLAFVSLPVVSPRAKTSLMKYAAVFALGAVAPREIRFMENRPVRSGKIARL
ncbi:MAG: hypothetical protein U1F16_05175 [Turneriella sp.]